MSVIPLITLHVSQGFIALQVPVARNFDSRINHEIDI